MRSTLGSTATLSRYAGLSSYLHRGHLCGARRSLPKTDDASEVIIHQLLAGETLDLLALRYYGREDLWWLIADANPNRFALDYRPGESISIPMQRFR